MKRMIRAGVGLALFCAASASLSPFAAASGEPQAGASAPASGAAAYVIGDKLKLTFFEEMELPAANGGSAASNFYQRADLTSDYRVGSDGFISIPRLGRILVAGRGEESVRDDIRRAYEDVMDRSGDVHVTIEERQPVYVLGPVRAPGAYAYSEGMVVLKALALAGGFQRSPQGDLPAAEGAREMERSEDAGSRLAALLARQAALEAAGRGRRPMAPDELVELVGAGEAERMVAREADAQAAAKAVRENEAERLRAAAAISRLRLSDLRASLPGIDGEIEARQAMIAAATEPDPRLSRKGEIAARSGEIARLDERRAQMRDDLREAERALSEQTAALRKIELDRGSGASRELAQLSADIMRLRQAARSASRLALTLGERPAGRGNAAQQPVEIVRLTPSGPTTLSGGAATLLQPGDVVTLGVGRSADGPYASAGNP